MELDMIQLEQRARRRWERQFKKRRTLIELIALTVPWWVVAIAASFFLLSMNHTAQMFDRAAPGFGWFAPIGVEFALMFTAFRRRQMGKISKSLATLEVLAFCLAVYVNGAGSLISVVSGTTLSGLTISGLLLSFSGLPATSQAALFLVPFFALVIPIGTKVAGEGIAELIAERKANGDLLTNEWNQVAKTEFGKEILNELVNNGWEVDKARRYAGEYIGTYRTRVSTVSRVSPVSQPDTPISDTPRLAVPDTPKLSAGPVSETPVEIAFKMLMIGTANPSSSLNELVNQHYDTGFSRSTWQRAMARYKAETKV